MNFKYLTTIATVIVILFSTALLINYRFNTEIQLNALIGTTTYSVGEVINSNNDFATVNFGDVMIYMDKNTQIKLLDGSENDLKINVIQGRVLIRGELTVNTRGVQTKTTGKTSFTHYSWLNNIVIKQLSGYTKIKMPQNNTLTLKETETLSIDTLSETIVSKDTFNQIIADKEPFFQYINNVNND